MKKNIVIGIVVVIVTIIIIIAIYLVNLLNNSNGMSGNQIKEKANKIFGYDYCTTDHTFDSGGDALTPWTCKLCGANATNPDTNAPKLCNDCARITSRCSKCGKLIK